MTLMYIMVKVFWICWIGCFQCGVIIFFTSLKVIEPFSLKRLKTYEFGLLLQKL